jgi:hypothetical protein
MKNFIKGQLVDICLIFGVIYLASKGVDGWGWLIFILFLRND